MKRLVAIALIISLLLSVMPFCAFAAEQEEKKPGQGVYGKRIFGAALIPKRRFTFWCTGGTATICGGVGETGTRCFQLYVFC